MNDNINLTGDEARLLMLALHSSKVSAPADMTLNLYLRLAQLSQVQPNEDTKST